MKEHYSHPEAHNRPGQAFGLNFVDRLSELSLTTGRTIEWHAHGETEVICCLRGSLQYEFRNRLGATVTSGCFLIVPPHMEHRLIGGVDGPCRRLSIFLLDRLPRKAPERIFTRTEYRDVLAEILKQRLRPRAIRPNTLTDLTRVADLTTKTKLSPRERVELRTQTANVLISLTTVRPPDSVKGQTRLIDEAIRWLQTHYAEKVTLGQLTTFMGYGQSRLYELFRERTGLPPFEWLVRFRIDKACALLKEQKLSIVETAQRVGFDDPSFFARTFRRRTGLSPSAYRTTFCT